MSDIWAGTPKRIKTMGSTMERQEQRIVELEAENERLRGALRDIADSGIENNSAWAWIGGTAKAALEDE